MQTVSLDHCLKCHLKWLNEGETVCPRCRTFSTTPKDMVVVAGCEVAVSAVVLHGSEVGLLDRAVRRGIDVLNLGERCDHGFISFRICPNCFNK